MTRFAHKAYDDIEARLLEGATAALKQANTHATFCVQGNEHWERMSIINATHAGELFIKAAIAKVHPLLIFQNVFEPEKTAEVNSELSLKTLIKSGKSHDFGKLPSVLWATTGVQITGLQVFKEAQEARNAVQHFVFDDLSSLSNLSLRFIYEVIDPLIKREFNMHAIEHHEDHSVGYDYIVDTVVRSNLKFSIPTDFDLGEIYLSESVVDCDAAYLFWLKSELARIGKSNLIAKRWIDTQ